MTALATPRFQFPPALALATAALLALAPVARATTPAAAVKDPCEGVPRCYNAGTFTAEVTQVSPTAVTKSARNQTVTINIRFRNVSDKPLILAYQAHSSSAQDNFGNAYYWGRAGTRDASAKGIGMVSGKTVDTQFSLAPGQARAATFNLYRYGAAPPIGEAWNYNLVIEEFEIQPGQVVRSIRQNSVSFENLRGGTFPVAGAAEAGDPVEVANKVIDLFKRNHKKQ